MRSLLLGLLVSALAIVSACGDTIVNVPTTPTPLGNQGGVSLTRIEFRVFGNPSSARVRYASPAEGLAQVVTTLPYSNVFTTAAENLFLSLEATPIAYPMGAQFPFFSIQIVVNGTLFREATSNEWLLNTLSVSGTWRR